MVCLLVSLGMLGLVRRHPSLSFRRDEVFVQRGEDGEWVHPDFETYGTSIELIYERIFGVRNSIPKFIELEIEDVVRKATMSTSLPRMKDAKDVIYDRFGESIEKDMALAKLNRSIKDLSEFLKQQSSTE